jgi:hypothetical protein
MKTAPSFPPLAKQAAEILDSLPLIVSGHDFSRAVNAVKSTRALAPAESFKKEFLHPNPYQLKPLLAIQNS